MTLEQDYTLKETADALRMSERWLRGKLAASNDGTGPLIEHERRGHKIMFTAAQVEKLRTAFTAQPATSGSVTTGRKKRSA